MDRTDQQLWQFYQERLLPDLRELEHIRLKAVQMLAIGAAVGLVVFAAIVVVGSARGFTPPILVFGLIGGIATSAIIGAIGQGDYKSHFKERIIRPLVAFLDENLSYQPAGSIHRKQFLDSLLFSRDPDRYCGDDLVTGMVGQTRVAFSEVHAEYKTTSTDNKGRTSESWHTIFKGLFFMADFNKNIRGETLIYPDLVERHLGRWGQMLQKVTLFGRHKLVKLEDASFERLFAVYSDDQIEARYILSPALMERIVAFRNRTGREIFLSFIGDHVCVAIPYTKDLFEPKIFSTLLDFEPVKEYFDDLQLAVGIVEELNLNTRIWSKGSGVV